MYYDKKLLTEQYNELAFYTLSLRDSEFIHQHIVDAQTVQMADENTKSISLIFSLAGLYLYVEKNYTGKQVQQFHILMAKHKTAYPIIILPLQRGNITAANVVVVTSPEERNRMIHNWCKSVWNACISTRETIKAIVEAYQNIKGY